MTTEWKLLPVEPDQIHQMAFEEGQPAENGDGYLFTAEEFDLFVDRLLTAAAPVPPAGGEVEVQRYQVVKMLTEDGNKIEYKPHGPWVVMADVHDALKAEGERLKDNIRWKAVADQQMQVITDLQSELTKARELNSVAADDLHQANVRAILAEGQLVQYQCRHEWIDNGEDLLVCPKCGKEDSDPEPFGWVQTSGPSINRFTQEWDVVEEWSDNGYEWVELFEGIAHQSAPAAKGGE